ncbi:AAA+ ATPase superfamily predicted ATPase [Parabacteroides sp. PFB2-12]|uniref:ATP-binding protein n=1 Tax=unclassified Parabacteroides TaxID=2649774 RepID=UPI0024754E48|nr:MULTISPECIES: ATP-binding protein [unclassified Parabacteroides]MDH6342210.1 AAA+ ATPase superfamily predicted ATPase [Parabacteroides sp. PM6-13]MDH6391106.1 AAA+ ATPase superfamily predicted ATPase [Parabacteroides sp. PFB2-12]
MKFYNREAELETLSEMRNLSFHVHSQMTVLTGRRRIGKTSLILESCKGTDTIYLFVNRGNEAALCKSFAETIAREFDIFVPEERSFARLFTFLMELGERKKYNLIIDEFQEFFHINQVVYSQIQDIWDRYRKKTHVNLIVSGSVYTLMNRIFKEYKEPLYGRADCVMKLSPFSTNAIKDILKDYKSDYSNDDLLALYTFTGGVPKYIELFMNQGVTDIEAIVDFMIRPESPFLSEGYILLIQEFGRKYGNYFSILTAIANGKNTIPEIEEALGGVSVTGHLKRLEEDYELIKKKRPIFAKEGTQTVRYEISDMFLRFWFRYFIKYNDLIESHNLPLLADIIKKDYPTYSGLTLEIYFRQKMMESHEFRSLGSWWEGKKSVEQNEIDIVGIYADDKRALVGEVKRQRKNFKPELFNAKVETIRKKVLFKYEIERKCLTLDDM